MNDLTSGLECFIIDLGASKCGFSELHGIPGRPFPELQFAVTVVLALAAEITAGIGNGPTPEYHDEYERINKELSVIGKGAVSFLIGSGFRAELLEATSKKFDQKTLSVPFPHKTAALRAGIGWIGKNDLLVTKDLGSAFRMCTILTDAPLSPGEPARESHCGTCTSCVDACPVGAPTGKDWKQGTRREELVDIFACYRHARDISRGNGWSHTICGICIEACPWTRRYISLQTGIEDSH